MNQCPWIPEQIYRFGDLRLLDSFFKDAKLSENGKYENVGEIIEALKYVFSQPGMYTKYELF